MGYLNRGNLYRLKLNRVQQALKDYDMGIELDKGLQIGYKNRGELYRELKRIKEAEMDE